MRETTNGEGRPRILVVDDEPAIGALLRELLTQQGYLPQVCLRAEDALERLQQGEERYALLFTDIKMPGMDGIELIRRARKLDSSLVPIVMTGYATLESARAAVREGAYDYVLKPFSVSEVLVAVKNALERQYLSLENARLSDLTELFKISESIAAIRQEHRLLDYVLRAALQRVGAGRGSIMVLLEDRALHVASGIGLPPEARSGALDLGQGIAGWVADNGIPLCVADIESEPDLAARSRGLASRSFISLPLLRQGGRRQNLFASHVLAVLNVCEKTSGEPFNEADLKILNIIANHAAAALENVRLIEDIEQAHLATLKSMAYALEAKDPYTHGHSERVRKYALIAAERLGMNRDDIDTLRLGAMLHDVGKIGVPDTILNKKEPLSPLEWGYIKQHPLIGYDMLAPVGFLGEEHLAIVRSHHERMDGSGYPDGLSKDNLSDGVRIISVADAFDAMSGDRAYRPGMSNANIVDELRRAGQSSLDPLICTLFIDLIADGELLGPTKQAPLRRQHA